MSSTIPFENLEPLLPLDFFSVELQIPFAEDLPKKRLLGPSFNLPDTHMYLEEEKFADCSLFWNEEGIFGEFFIHKEYEQSTFPDFELGDSIEIFIDTRDMKKAGFATKFCHHFVFLAHPVQEIQAQEVSKFRSEDSHPLCEADLLKMDVKYGKNDYTLQFFISTQCLMGFDPTSFPRIGFTYKINRYKGPAQHFSVSSAFFDVMQNPSLWASVSLVKN
ncbi:MAG: hypothetical protein FJZ57_00280 [Chlamydiae bacterium]|nr:hypothetical protein [Chlamydiota bacterium]